VWSFDRIVIPAGATVQGRVVSLDPVPRMLRAKAIAGGDFTPLKRAEVLFTTLTLPDHRELRINTAYSLGLATIYVPPSKRKSPEQISAAPKHGKIAQAKSFLKQQAVAQANARGYGLYDLVRGPNKREWLQNFALSKLPYHPQWYRSGTRFDAVLTQPLEFGTASLAVQDLASIGSQPAPDSVAQMRLLSIVTSADAKVGDPVIGSLSKPLFSADHKLVLPEGTRLNGRVTLAHSARYFHRGGKLRFAIDSLDLPTDINAFTAEAKPGSASAHASQPVQGQVVAAETDPNSVKVDGEGTARATDSKTRLLRPAVAFLVAAKSLDNDTGKTTATGSGDANTAGRSLGGFSGFGLLGIAASRGPSEIGAALGFYGLAWSAYNAIVSRGREVVFLRNTDMAIRFGARSRPH
jgi:hypothetical protein